MTLHRGVDAPWLAGLAVVLVAFAVTWVAQPIGDRSESGLAVVLVGLVVLCRRSYAWRASRVSTGELAQRDSARRTP